MKKFYLVIMVLLFGVCQTTTASSNPNYMADDIDYEEAIRLMGEVGGGPLRSTPWSGMIGIETALNNVIISLSDDLDIVSLVIGNEQNIINIYNTRYGAALYPSLYINTTGWTAGTYKVVVKLETGVIIRNNFVINRDIIKNTDRKR